MQGRKMMKETTLVGSAGWFADADARDVLQASIHTAGDSGGRLCVEISGEGSMSIRVSASRRETELGEIMQPYSHADRILVCDPVPCQQISVDNIPIAVAARLRDFLNYAIPARP